LDDERGRFVSIGYCYKLQLHGQHSIAIQGIQGKPHAHTWYLSIYVQYHDDFSLVNQAEEILKQVLDPYQNQYLNSLAPFDQIDPTLENIGEQLFRQLEQVLQGHQIKIQRLEISETPVRIYVVDAKTLSPENKNSNLPLSGFLQGLIRYTKDEMAFRTSDKEERLALKSQEPLLNDAREESGRKDEAKTPVSPVQIPTTQVRTSWRTILLAILTLLGSTVLLLVYVNLRGQYPWGSDSFGHVFKADLLYHSIKAGVYFPQYTELWYNGIQPFRYWAPLPYYILAAFQFLAGGNAIEAYNLFIGFCFLFGALGWLLWGVQEKRVGLSLVFGILWFCFPDNVRVFFSEGNIPRVVITVILPYFFFVLWRFIEHKKKGTLIWVLLLMATICLVHLMIAAMMGITVFLFLLYYGIANKTFVRPMQALFAMLLGISLCGIWLYPALQGGIMAMDQSAVSEVMKELTFPITQSLNPLLRFHNIELYYFGAAFVLISIFGLCFSNRKSIPGFLTLITIFLGTTTAFVPILMKLPFNQLLWMMRFTPVAYAVFVLAFVTWKSLKRYVTILLILLLVVESGISFHLLAFNSNPSKDLLNMLDQAAEMTNQRIAILDGSEFGSLPSYYLCSGAEPVSYSYGWAWQGAATAENLVLLNTALEKECYDFLFDRCLEAGCDTVLVKKDKVKVLEKLNTAAKRIGYQLEKEFQNGYLYHMKTLNNFGLKSKYQGLALGLSARNIVLEFPDFEIGNSNVLDDYSLDELLQHQVIYLSGFEYRDQKKAERLVLDAAAQGVKVVIDMNRVPTVAITNRMTFLGVTAQPIQFENKLPDLHFRGLTYFPIHFQEENKIWNTVYLENVPNPRGFSWFGGNKLTFIGEHSNQNITFIGFNLLFHGIANDDPLVIDMFGTAIEMLKDTLPERTIVPINIEYKENKISIHSVQGDINTTLANLDVFHANAETYSKHNYLYVTEPDTELSIQYPYWQEGAAVSIAGLVASVLFFYAVWRRKGREASEKTDSDRSPSPASME